MISLLNMWCAQLAQVAHLVAMVNGIHRVYFCGGFVEHEKVQELVTGQFNKRNGVAKVNFSSSTLKNLILVCYREAGQK